ncbi:uncharacterized protein [Manis javanica]|uniref:uncharacterized protein isoform X1 n=1 Tax=Manis javanica TaxID=9974 RepID=UPI003C6D4665
MSNLLCIDDIDVPDEEAIVNAVMQWVGYDVQGRQQDLEMLLSYVRLPLLPPQNMGIRIYNSSVSENVSLPSLDSITTVLYGRTQEPASETFCVPTAWKHKRPCGYMLLVDVMDVHASNQWNTLTHTLTNGVCVLQFLKDVDIGELQHTMDSCMLLWAMIPLILKLRQLF